MVTGVQTCALPISTKLTIGKSTFKPANESGECYEPDGIVLYALSSDNSVLMRTSTDPTSTSTGMWLSGAWTVHQDEIAVVLTADLLLHDASSHRESGNSGCTNQQVKLAAAEQVQQLAEQHKFSPMKLRIA